MIPDANHPSITSKGVTESTDIIGTASFFVIVETATYEILIETES